MNKPLEVPKNAVVLKAIHKSYRVGSVDTPVLRGIDLAIETHHLSVLSGPSGSGKTTLLNLIGCIDRPDSGELTILGTKVAAFTDNQLSDFRREHLGFIFQNFNLLAIQTALENVEHPLLMAGVSRKERRARATEALEQVDLGDHLKKLPNQLSGGQRQRVAIARALVKNPSLVLADEPTANLDSENSASILALMRTLQSRNKIAFIISSHDPEVKAQADRVYAIRDGMLIHPGGERSHSHGSAHAPILENVA